jgi:uncharacterized RDD family membrane protein YckC
MAGVDTPPGSPRYAGFWIRVFANVLDVLWLSAVNTVILWILVDGQSHLGPGVGSVSAGVGEAAVQFGALLPAVVIVGFWILKGATPGKMMCRLHIVDEVSGRRPTVWQCIGRYVLGVIVIAAGGIGYFWIALDRRHQGWHDKIVRTLVVRR